MNRHAPRSFTLALAFLLGAWAAAGAAGAQEDWLDLPVPPKPEMTPELAASGKLVYDQRCSFCHGAGGEADGPVAVFLDPRPRDFFESVFKFRTTRAGELPTDEDLYRTITRGVPGTAMPTWEGTLTPEERWQVIAYLKTFSEDFSDPDFDPYRKVEEGEDQPILTFSSPPPATPELLQRAAKLFRSGKCVDCHGEAGRGNGDSAGEQFDHKRRRIWPRDLTKPWRYKTGAGVRDTFRTLTTGLNGVAMPSYIGTLVGEDDPEGDEEVRWALAHSVRSLQEEPEEGSLLVVRKLEGGLPSESADPRWDDADEIAVPLTGQATFAPRWQTPAVDLVRVRALHDGHRIAFRLAYHDRTESTRHEDPDVVEADSTYPEIDVSRFEHASRTLRDAAALQFPARPVRRAERPYFIYGSGRSPVILWRWEADRQGASKLLARGPRKIEEAPAGTDGDPSGPGGEGGSRGEPPIRGKGVFEDGRWTVVLEGPLQASGSRWEVDFLTGAAVPFTLMVWDGGAGESGLQHSLSSWVALAIESPTPKSAYLYGIAVMLGLGAFEILLLWRSRRRLRAESS